MTGTDSSKKEECRVQFKMRGDRVVLLIDGEKCRELLQNLREYADRRPASGKFIARMLDSDDPELRKQIRALQEGIGGVVP